MNRIFEPYLRKFVLVFFDDILIYSSSLKQYLKHLRTTFKILRFNRLYLKRSKCAFAQTQIEYLGHVIPKEGVGTNPKKIKAITAWPKPTNIRALRGFLGLTRYYRKFVKNYDLINKPLIDQLKKEGFKWGQKANEAFEQLKRAMSKVSVLGLSDFTKPFTLEMDASGVKVGVVLSQEGRPLAFLNQALSPRHQSPTFMTRNS